MGITSFLRSYLQSWTGSTTPEAKPVLHVKLMRTETGKLLRVGAKLPTRGTPFAIGLDLYTPAAFTVQSHKNLLVPLGIAVAIPEGHYGRIAPKSGVSYKFTASVEAGVLDADYRQEVGLILSNYGDAPISFEAGKSVAQLILERATIADVQEVNDLDETVRSGGFGSTGAGAGAGSINAAVAEQSSNSATTTIVEPTESKEQESEDDDETDGITIPDYAVNTDVKCMKCNSSDNTVIWTSNLMSHGYPGNTYMGCSNCACCAHAVRMSRVLPDLTEVAAVVTTKTATVNVPTTPTTPDVPVLANNTESKEQNADRDDITIPDDAVDTDFKCENCNSNEDTVTWTSTTVSNGIPGNTYIGCRVEGCNNHVSQVFITDLAEVAVVAAAAASAPTSTVDAPTIATAITEKLKL
jgi:dUTP pyrophosphatase